MTEDALGNFEALKLDYVPEEEGYMTIYTANQTSENLNVYFDDMAITHTSGPINFIKQKKYIGLYVIIEENSRRFDNHSSMILHLPELIP